MRRWIFFFGYVLLGIVVVLAIGWMYVNNLERKLLTIGPNGSQTPATFGMHYRRIRIAAVGHTLDSYVVPAASTCKRQVALLIFHGVRETISDWARAQHLLYTNCISSMVFDYAGEGDSTGIPSPKIFDADAPAVYTAFTRQFTNISRRCVLGFSMGNGIMLSQITRFLPAPSCVIVGSAFNSGRASAHYGAGVPWIFLDLFPDPWNNVRNVVNVRSSLLVVHSDADRANSLWMGKEVFSAAPAPKRLAVVHGVPHYAPMRASAVWWSPVIVFLRSGER